MVHECVRNLRKGHAFTAVDISISNLAAFDEIQKPTIL